MPNRDGIVSIGFDYKKDLEKMIKDFEAEMNTVSSNTQLSKGMKKQFDNILAEMRDFKSSMDKELANLGSGKVSQSSFKSFKQTVENKFKGIREDIDRLDVSMSDLNKKMGILDSGFSLDKFSKEFEDARQRVISTNDAIENLIHTLGEQGISLFSFDDRNISEIKSLIKEIEKEFQNKRKKDYSLLNQDELQNEYNILHAEFSKLIGQIKFAKKEMSSLEVDSNGFKKAQAQFDLLRFKALNVADAIGLIEDASFDKFELSISEKTNKAFQKNSDILTESVENIEERARLSIKTLNELLSVLNSPKIKDEDATTVSPIITLNTTSKELWEALKPELDKLQKTLNSNPVVTPVKLMVAPTSVSYVETGNLDTSKSYSKKYQKILAKTGEDAVVDLEGVYKKTFTSVMDTAVSYAKDTIDKIQDVFDKNLIKVKFDINQDELDKIQNFVLSNKDGKKVDISGQITKAKQEVEELNESIEKTAKLLDDAKSKGNVKFDGFDKFTQDVSKSISKLEELQNILKALQNIEITLAKASGIASITELDNQWANVEKRIINATKLDGSFRKNASVSKIASEYQKYIDMGGTNSIADIDKIKDNKDTLDTIISKAKEFAKQDLSNDSVKELSIELDGIIGKFDELISTVKTATNALYKIIKQTGVSELDKQWSSITNKFKSIADESGKINLSKQKKDVEELLVMYQRYVNMGGSHTPFDLTDNLETVAKLDKAYKKLNETKPIDNSSTIKSETESFRKVEQSVESLTKAIGDTKVQAINVEATAMEDAAEREILAINAIVDSLDTVVKKLKEIKGIKPKIEIKETTSPVETNISSGNKIDTAPIVESQNKLQDELEETDKSVQKVLYHFGELTKLGEQSAKSRTLGKGYSNSNYAGLNSLTGLYLTGKKNEVLEKAMSFSHKYTGADISSIDISGYNLFMAETDEIAEKIKLFFSQIGELTSQLHRSEDTTKAVPSNLKVETVYGQMKELFGDISLTYEQFENFIKNCRNIVSKYNLNDLLNPTNFKGNELPEEIRNMDSFQTQIMKMLGFEGLDLSKTSSYSGTNGVGTVVFDIGKDKIVEVKTYTEAIEELTKAKEKASSSTPIEDTFQGDTKVSAESSTPAVKDEAKAMEQVAENAEKASKGKDKFSKANKKVKESADSSADSIEKETSALDEKEWDKNVKVIQKYMDANTELNKLKAKDKGTGKHASEIAYQTKEVEKFEKAALEARATLSSMINPHEAPIDDWNKWLEMMRQFDQATEGSARSVAQLEDALRNMAKAQLDSEQSKINSYIKKLNPYTDITKYTSEFISRANSTQSEIKKIDVASPEGLARLKEMDLIVDEIISDSKLLENKLVKQDSKIADIISKMKIFRDSNTNMSKSQRADLQALIDSAEVMAKTGDVTAEAIEHIKIGYSGIKAEVTATGNTGLKMIDRIVQRTEDMNAKFIAQFFSWQDWFRYCKEGITVIRELDTALTEMRKVSDESVDSLKKFQKASFDLADSIGTTALEVQNSTADFMRLGYTLEEASKLSQDANIYANVGDMNIDEATEHMISSIQAWRSEFDSTTQASTEIIDRYNKIGNEFAITSADIGSAMERTSAALKAGGNTLNESIGLITAGNLIQQDADTTANALKVMSLRIRGSKVELESMGETTDDLADSTSKLREQIKALTGVDIMLDDNTFKSTARIIQEIGAEWSKLTDISQSATLELLAGKTRASTVAGLIENYETIDKVITAAENADGSALAENEKYLESIEGKIASLKNELQSLAYDLIDSGTIKDIIDAGKNIISIINKITDGVSLLSLAIGGLSSYGLSNLNLD